jgi:palmitoyltransferase
MTSVSGGILPPIDRITRPSSSKVSIEEACFQAALISLEGHYTDSPPMPGPKTQARVTAMVSRTLEKTHTLKDVRETLSKNVEIWIYLTKIFAAAVPSMSTRSVGAHSDYHDSSDPAGSVQDSSTLIIKNYTSLKEDLQMLNKLMHIARNLLVTSEPEVPQDICAAVSFDQMVYQTIIVCINVTSKGYDVDVLDDGCRVKLNEINELCGWWMLGQYSHLAN